MQASTDILSGKTSNDYLPVLDGLRAVSILLVVLSHCGMGLEHVFPGTLGVIIFFVISGFLITRQMVAEIEKRGRFSVGAFYLRRVLRLFPALFAYLLIFTPLLLYLGSNITFMHLLTGMVGLANYYHLFIGYPAYNPMPILWSLSVEEHYYLVFPFVMLAFRKRLPAVLPVLVCIMATALIWRIALYKTCLSYASPFCALPGKIRAQGTDTSFDCIMYGAFFALMLHYYSEKIYRVLVNREAFVTALLVLLISLIIRDAEFRATLRYSLQAAGSAVILVNVIYGKAGRLQAFFTNNLMIFTGKISYALYLMHFGVLITIEAICHSRQLNTVSEVLLYLFLSFFLASCTYVLIEKPMLAIRHKERKA